MEEQSEAPERREAAKEPRARPPALLPARRRAAQWGSEPE